jgi:hypothetical protein
MDKQNKTAGQNINVRFHPSLVRKLDALLTHYQTQFPAMSLNYSDIVRMAVDDMAKRELNQDKETN